MKVAIPVSGADAQAPTASVFGRCPAFVFLDLESGDAHTLPNPALEAPGGAGIQAARFVVGRGVDVVISREVGPKALDVLESGGVKVHVHHCDSVSDALQSYREASRT